MNSLQRRNDLREQMAMTMKDYPNIASAVESKQFSPDDEAIMLAKHGEMVVLNLVGSYIWSLLDTCSEKEICSEVVSKFDVSDAVAEADTRHFLDRLEDLGLLNSDGY